MSLWSDFKNTAWYVADRRWLPNVRVAYTARVSCDCTMGKSITIAPMARVYATTLGDRVSIHRGSSLNHCRLEGDSVIGPDCDLGSVEFGRYSYMAGTARAGHIRFGRFCSIGPDFLCGRGDHPTNRISGSPVFYSTQKQSGMTFASKDLFTEWKPIHVGNDVVIGARVFIRDGVTIGDGAMIGAGAIVAHDVPAYAIVGGVPAKIIRMRFSEDIVQELLALSWWNWDQTKLRQAQPLLAQTDPRAFLNWAKTV